MQSFVPAFSLVSKFLFNLSHPPLCHLPPPPHLQVLKSSTEIVIEFPGRAHTGRHTTTRHSSLPIQHDSPFPSGRPHSSKIVAPPSKESADDWCGRLGGGRSSGATQVIPPPWPPRLGGWNRRRLSWAATKDSGSIFVSISFCCEN